METAAALKRTPLYQTHVDLGAHMCEFGGWDMPIGYPKRTKAEHIAVRTRVGLFDVSHMGEFRISGPQALELLRRTMVNDATTITIGQAQYTMMVKPSGGTIDDLLVYRKGEQVYTLVVNAARTEADWDWLSSHALDFPGVRLENISDSTALIAVQGPLAQATVSKLTKIDLKRIEYYHFTRGIVAGIQCLLSRTGYTGEDGFELMSTAKDAVALWSALLEAGKEFGIEPAGLGARDTLRLEYGLCLYGHELDEETSPIEAGLGKLFVKLNRPEMIGYEALLKQQLDGVEKKLIGFRLLDPGIARPGHAIQRGNVVGIVTSGTKPFTVNEAIGMGYVPPSLAFRGTVLDIEIREGRTVKAIVVKKPFYTRPKETV